MRWPRVFGPARARPAAEAVRQVIDGGEPAWLITAASARSARGRGRTPPARSGRTEPSPHAGVFPPTMPAMQTCLPGDPRRHADDLLLVVKPVCVRVQHAVGMTLGPPEALKVSQRPWLDPARCHPDKVLLHRGLLQAGAGWPPPTRPAASPGCLTDYSCASSAKQSGQGRIRTRPSRGQERQLRELPTWWTNDLASRSALSPPRRPRQRPCIPGAPPRSGGAARPCWQGRSTVWATAGAFHWIRSTGLAYSSRSSTA